MSRSDAPSRLVPSRSAISTDAATRTPTPTVAVLVTASVSIMGSLLWGYGLLFHSDGDMAGSALGLPVGGTGQGRVTDVARAGGSDGAVQPGARCAGMSTVAERVAAIVVK